MLGFFLCKGVDFAAGYNWWRVDYQCREIVKEAKPNNWDHRDITVCRRKLLNNSVPHLILRHMSMNIRRVFNRYEWYFAG